MGQRHTLLQEIHMKKFLSSLCATTIAASFALADIVSANAATVYVPQSVPARIAPDITPVKNPNLDPGHGYRYPRNFGGRNAYRHKGKSNFYRNKGNYYYNGHRGYRNHRRGYRQYNGYWFPAGAFIAGALLGGAINAPRANYGNSHVQWCYNRYRSYRASDNTFQPYNGPRQQCYSPY
jgi:hypothetical protein